MIDDELFGSNFFAEENDHSEEDALRSKPWIILLVDDEEEIHRVTTMALSNFEFDNRPLKFISTYSASEGKQAFLDNDDIAMVLLDVVMETEHAGLDLAKWIREEHGNLNSRIVLRTGQPGQAPEQSVIQNYDINDYKAKTELTVQKLHTATLTALRSYQHICILENSKLGMEQVVKSTKHIMGKIGFEEFARAALEQITTLIDVEDSLLLDLSHYKYGESGVNSIFSICGTGIYASEPNHYREVEQVPVVAILNRVLTENESIFDKKECMIFCRSEHHCIVFYMATEIPLLQLDKHLLEVFTENLVIGLKNIDLNEQMKHSQREVIYRLTEVVESRSNETGNHVKRVARYSELLAQLYGLDFETCQSILFASPLHDIGKVGIPDQILNKPGKLNEEEWEVMKTHAQLGQEMLSGSGLTLIELGADIAGTHHERWDGNGYPQGLSGENIPIAGRIVALTDIFDALSSKRVYKGPWTVEEVVSYLEAESGKFFEPKLVELFLANKQKFLQIKEELQDPE